jgi:DNA-directed RNA polymerase beta' subunit
MDSSSHTFDEEIRPIDYIEFSVWPNEEILRGSALGKDSLGVDIPDLYDNMEPKRGGLIDPRMGPIGNNNDCASCGLNPEFCVGHFGHIDLAEPIFHMGYIEYVKKILSCICLRCSKLLVYKNEDEYAEMLKNKSGKKRFAEIRNLAKNVSYCQKANYGCGAPVSKIKKEIKKTSGVINMISELNPTTVQMESNDFDGKKKIRRILTPDDCYNILKNINDIDCMIMGLDPKKSRPEMMIHKIFPVPPVQVRPSVKADFMNSATMEDDLTHKLADIIKANIRIRKYKESLNDTNAKYSQDHQHLLQFHGATYLNNESLAIRAEQRGKSTKSLESRIKGKGGRIRNNLMGKRVDFSARSVITPDPTIDINQLGVPLKVAMNLTFPEVVTPHNLEYLSKLVRNGRHEYPGANFVFPVSNMNRGGRILPIDLRYRKGKVELRYGDVVERHLIDGDFVLLNRQPTLHKLSMLGHRIKVILNDNLRTFRLNVAVTTPYNADFDGDEMNIFVPQSLSTQIELQEIADVKRQIITPATSTPIIGIVQDGLLGSYNLTSPNMRIDWKEAMNIISYTTFDDLDSIKKNTDYKGTDIFSLIIPNDINVSGKIEIKNGHIKKGILDKTMLKAKKQNSLIHLIYDQYGIEETKDFIDNTQRLINNFNMYNGFTVGIGDIDISEELQLQMSKLFETKKLEVKHIITEMENNPDLYDSKTFESSIYGELNNIRETASKFIMNNMKPDNNFNIMISSGSKGDPVNMAQMVGCVGQQAVEGQRIKKKVNGRSLPYFFQNDDSAQARGFIEEPFVFGLTPQSFIFQNMSAREGMIDTAIKSVTRETPIIILENGKTKRVLIGDWIDERLEKSTDDVEHHEEREMELLNLVDNVYIPTSDLDGNISWGYIKAITRHDPGKELYEIKTLGGRKVIVTESKSLLVWSHDDQQFIRMNTPDVKVGNFVPVTMTLCEPPTKIENIELTDFLPKTEYLYGTDFQLALNKLDDALKGRDKNSHLPNGWWKMNNGKEFTLPYDAVGKVRRLIKQSNISKIKNGYVYPFSSNIESALIPDKLELNRENGLFIGLFLAEGNVDIKSGYVQICNNDRKIKDFTKKWFNKMNIKHKESTKINNIGGTSSQVRGFSTLLAKLLTKMVGHGAKHKHVPEFAFNAPDEFILGMISGYISGDGTVTKNSIQVTSASKELIEGINMLLSRFGIFGKISKTTMKKNNVGTKDIADINVLSVRGQWATLFSDKINLFNDSKQNQLENIKASASHRNFEEHNDVILDKIISIEPIDVKKYPKVYDLTVPSTLNFGLANGLHVVDTAESGYIQRKLIKYMEDLMVTYDLTARTSNNNVIQFSYGDNNIDSTKQSRHTLAVITMGNKEALEKFKFTKQELKNFKLSPKENDEFFAEFLKLRDDMRIMVRQITLNYIRMKDNFVLPVNILRIISNIKNSQSKSKEKLDPKYVLDKLHDLLSHDKTTLFAMSKKNADNKKSMKYVDEMDSKTIFKLALYEFLAPKVCIFEYKLNKGQFDEIYKQIINTFNKSVIEPGEMIGTIAAQSIGEPVTQLTLNSIDWNDKLLVNEDGVTYNVEIGKYIDTFIKNNPNKVKRLTDNVEEEMGDTYYVDVSDKDIKAISVDENGKLKWNKVTALTKHLPMNKDGTHDLVKITTRLGRSVTATKAKSFLTRIDNKVMPIRGDEIKVGTHVPIMINYPKNKSYLKTIGIKHIFPKNEYIYGSEIEKARKIKTDANNNGSRLWFKHNINKKFTVPYSRQDSLKKEKDMVAQIPEEFKLDKLFGFFVGAYLAEGLSTKTYIAIRNNDKVFQKWITNFCDAYNIGYHLQIQNDKIKKGWTSIDVRIHSVILAKIMKTMFNTGSKEKCLPSWVFDANNEFVKYLLNGYFSGDGTVSVEINQVAVCSISEKLIDDIALLLTRFNILSKKSKPSLVKTNNRGSKNINQTYTLSIRNNNIHKFYAKIGSIVIEKQKRLKKISTIEFRYSNGMYDVIPGININRHDTIMRRKDIVELLKSKTLNDEDTIIMKNAAENNDIYFDEIVKIECVKPSNKYVYDMTIENDKTFVVSSGICCYDTFHHAGIGGKGTTTLGVPRMKELLSFSKNMKTPIMSIYLNDKLRKNKDMADKIASYVKHTTIADIRKRIDVYYDPNPFKKDSFMEKDNVFNVFNRHNPTKNSCQNDITGLPWLMRIELDKEKMMNKEITLLDIKSKFCSNWERRYKDIKKVKKEEKQLLEKVTQCAILSNNDNDKISIVHLRFDMKDFNFGTIVGFLDVFVENFKLKGIKGIAEINSVSPERILDFDNENQEKNETKQNVIYTSGINMDKIRYINGVDQNKTICNDIVITYHKFGIDAARALLLYEINNVFEGAGNTVNYQHISVLADMMTTSGILTSVDRFGVNKMDIDPLTRASFEKSVDHVITAAVFGEVDTMRSVSSRIMAGLAINGGTGLCDIILDTELLENSEYIEDIDQKYQKTFTELDTNIIMDDIVGKEATEMFVPM